eukprot:364904-Chlamydomonas_euryale.AAC.14
MLPSKRWQGSRDANTAFAYTHPNTASCHNFAVERCMKRERPNSASRATPGRRAKPPRSRHACVRPVPLPAPAVAHPPCADCHHRCGQPQQPSTPRAHRRARDAGFATRAAAVSAPCPTPRFVAPWRRTPLPAAQRPQSQSACRMLPRRSRHQAARKLQPRRAPAPRTCAPIPAPLTAPPAHLHAGGLRPPPRHPSHL